MAENNEEKLYNRADKVMFMGLTKEATSFNRMTGFTDNGKTLNAETYERRYIDEKTSRKDVVGYATEIAYAFDRYTNNNVQDKIAEVHDEELTGVTLPFVQVDFNQKDTSGNYKAFKRDYSIIPDGDGDGTDAYQYSGTFAAAGEIIKGTATSEDSFKTCTFTPNTSSDT